MSAKMYDFTHSTNQEFVDGIYKMLDTIDKRTRFWMMIKDMTEVELSFCGKKLKFIEFPIVFDFKHWKEEREYWVSVLPKYELAAKINPFHIPTEE